MKHYNMTAVEAIGWMRICRPGSVIGPQQHFLQEMESTMHKEGMAFRDKRKKSGSMPEMRHMSDPLNVRYLKSKGVETQIAMAHLVSQPRWGWDEHPTESNPIQTNAQFASIAAVKNE